jgi:hypothetical protein
METTPMPTTQKLVSWLLALLAIIAITWAMFGGAKAATFCLPFTATTEKLASIGQEITYIATTANGTTVFVAVNTKTGDWSLFAEPNYDKACVLMLGEGWEAAPDSVRHPPTN